MDWNDQFNRLDRELDLNPVHLLMSDNHSNKKPEENLVNWGKNNATDKIGDLHGLRCLTLICFFSKKEMV